jgi:hypothetical protein
LQKLMAQWEGWLLSCEAAPWLCSAAKTLENMAFQSAASCERIGWEPRAITDLTALLSSLEAGIQQAAAAALSNLASESAANMERIVQEPGAVENLVALLSSSESRVQTEAARALVSLAFKSPCDHAAARDQTLNTSSGVSGTHAKAGAPGCPLHYIHCSVRFFIVRS